MPVKMSLDFASEMISQIMRLTEKYFPIEKPVSISSKEVLRNYDILSYLRFTGTYILRNKKRIIYVGVSDNIGQRILGHFNSRISFAGEISSIQIIRFQLWEQAEALESILINRIRPKYNRSIPPLGSYLFRLGFKERERTKTVVNGIADDIAPQIGLDMRFSHRKTVGKVANA